MLCHPEPGVKLGEGPYDGRRWDALEQRDCAAVSLRGLLCRIGEGADVRSLAPAAPPLRMTSLKEFGRIRGVYIEITPCAFRKTFRSRR
jgi:hypothetical protein